MLDAIKNQGYKYSTKSGITVAVSDATIPPHKLDLLSEAEEKIDEITAASMPKMPGGLGF